MSLEKTVKKLSKPARKVLKLKYCGAVIVAAGSASRMGGIDKVMEPVGGLILVSTLPHFTIPFNTRGDRKKVRTQSCFFSPHPVQYH